MIFFKKKKKRYEGKEKPHVGVTKWNAFSLSTCLRYSSGGISGSMGPPSSSRCLWATCAPCWAEWTAAPPATPTPVTGRPTPIDKVCPVSVRRRIKTSFTGCARRAVPIRQQRRISWSGVQLVFLFVFKMDVSDHFNYEFLCPTLLLSLLPLSD